MNEYARRLSELRESLHSIETSTSADVSSLIDEALKLAERAIAEREIAIEKSITDPGTGLRNKRYFQERMNDVWADAARNGRSVALVVLDIDHFKAYNDTYGHGPADGVLAQVASAIGATAERGGDTACRWGGEEFALILPDTDAANAVKIAELARANVAGLEIPHAGSRTSANVTVSVGVAACIPTRGSDPHVIFEAADAALLAAKERGRNGVVLGTVESELTLPADGSRFTGEIIAAADGVVRQSIGRGREVEHPAERLSRELRLGEVVTVAYENGRATVLEQDRGDQEVEIAR